MAQRQIILDTETTGIRVEDGHRIIEIGCIELVNRKFTNNTFHCYLNPLREVDAGAIAVHGITNEFLRDKPEFKVIAKEFMQFINKADVIIHNAPFDVSFLNHELILLNSIWKAFTDHCNVIDTLQMARKLHVGQRNNLDALCKRYAIDNSKREYHGALLDAHLLAQVYLAMTGGQGNFFEMVSHEPLNHNTKHSSIEQNVMKNYKLVVIHADDSELNAHQQYLESMKAASKCLWLDD